MASREARGSLQSYQEKFMNAWPRLPLLRAKGFGSAGGGSHGTYDLGGLDVGAELEAVMAPTKNARGVRPAAPIPPTPRRRHWRLRLVLDPPRRGRRRGGRKVPAPVPLIRESRSR